jgi:predicted Zn-dependent peptidase
MKDPIELPGLAHFCEHMLFLGTKKVILLFCILQQMFRNIFVENEENIIETFFFINNL